MLDNRTIVIGENWKSFAEASKIVACLTRKFRACQNPLAKPVPTNSIEPNASLANPLWLGGRIARDSVAENDLFFSLGIKRGNASNFGC